MDPKYMPRIADKRLELSLATSGAVLIVGPKWCGKTRTAEEAASVLYMQDPDHAEEYKLLADTKPSKLLEGETPRLIDEWQVAPVLWNAVRFAVDRRRSRGQFILTGSVVPPETKDMHTGTGRISGWLCVPCHCRVRRIHRRNFAERFVCRQKGMFAEAK